LTFRVYAGITTSPTNNPIRHDVRILLEGIVVVNSVSSPN
jgi:hypothetical protein